MAENKLSDMSTEFAIQILKLTKSIGALFFVHIFKLLGLIISFASQISQNFIFLIVDFAVNDFR